MEAGIDTMEHFDVVIMYVTNLLLINVTNDFVFPFFALA